MCFCVYTLKSLPLFSNNCLQTTSFIKLADLYMQKYVSEQVVHELNELRDYHSEVDFIHLKVYETEMTICSVQAVNAPHWLYRGVFIL